MSNRQVDARNPHLTLKGSSYFCAEPIFTNLQKVSQSYKLTEVVFAESGKRNPPRIPFEDRSLDCKSPTNDPYSRNPSGPTNDLASSPTTTAVRQTSQPQTGVTPHRALPLHNTGVCGCDLRAHLIGKLRIRAVCHRVGEAGRRPCGEAGSVMCLSTLVAGVRRTSGDS